MKSTKQRIAWRLFLLCSLWILPIITDARGSLSFGEYGDYLPFVLIRYFAVFDVPLGHVRGGHAHLTTHQFLVSVKGSVSIVVDDRLNSEEILLKAVRLLRDAALRRSMGERACGYVRREWNVEKSVDRLEANLLRVTGGARRKAACFAH